MGWDYELNFQGAPVTEQVFTPPSSCLQKVHASSEGRLGVKHEKKDPLRHADLSQVQGDKPLGLGQERNAKKSPFKALPLHGRLQADLQK